MQDALRDKELLLRALIDAMSEGLVVCDPEGRFLLLNAQAGHLLPGSADHDLQSAVQDLQFFYEDQKTPFPSKEASLVNAIRGKPTPPHNLFLRRKGSEGLYLQSSGLPVRNAAGEVIAGIALFRDISGLKKISAAIAAAQATLAEMEADASTAWLSGRSLAEPVSFGGSAVALLGNSLLAAAPDQWYRISGWEWSEPGALFLGRALKGETVGCERVVTKDSRQGTIRHLEVSAWPVYGAEHSVIAAVAVLQDVTAVQVLGRQLEGVRELLTGDGWTG